MKQSTKVVSVVIPHFAAQSYLKELSFLCLLYLNICQINSRLGTGMSAKRTGSFMGFVKPF